jgi:SAM-dependent methyltransferase
MGGVSGAADGRPSYLAIAQHYERCLDRHGDTYLGVDWPNSDDANARYRVMLEVMRPFPPDGPVRLLDFGCGASHLYEHITRRRISGIEYIGLDISERFVELSRRKFPANRYWCGDVLAAADEELPRADYAVMNGVFTEKVSLSYEEMTEFFRATVMRVFGLVDRGVAFNVMSKHVDWERDDLFHVPLDEVAAMLVRDFTRDFVIRNDYGLYEYTVYAYHR